ncbi:lysine decarboxylase [Roseateles sp. DAIF2]|uniref:Orn/Lys/Arg family decarboxylase n=1 Tax=Roseateles sp. DAIF2 TaxID=2714952 RepID=UPI0018A27D55|nr:Orn/Lys/Arg decarboxylase N-terminal domain-containing protein [Roseateles sp. DAIF2]QPF71650.1 lysine decarboxylase [Roseateles sp. DAIF2]
MSSSKSSLLRSFEFPVAVLDRDFQAEHIGGILVRALAQELQQQGAQVLSGLTLEDVRVGGRSFNAVSAVLVSIDGSEAQGEAQWAEMQSLLALVRERHGRLPIFLYGERRTAEALPTRLLREVQGYIYLFEDTKTFIARQVLRAAEDYVESLFPPFFKALVRHCLESNMSWHTPGHAGGVAFTKSPVGRTLHQFFGENTLRSDLSISVPELGSLLDHSGPIKAAEAAAARNFGADHTFFVTNGTSTANKIVWHGNVGRDDIVFIDRNCHKSLLHAMIMTGAIPCYFRPSRNAHGIIGPISRDQFEPEAMRAVVAAHPLAGKIAGGRPRMAVVTNSTYDGLCYNARQITDTIGSGVDFLHFDEAWYAYAAFHPFYAGRYGMDKGGERAEHPVVFTTHSTHKLLAAFSQASMIHVRNSRQRRLDVDRFNEAFMMHTSTSPNYAIIAGCDVASHMMEGAAGPSLVQEMHGEAMRFRVAMQHIRGELAREDWWFEVWQPEAIARRLASGDDAAIAQTRAEDWVLEPGAAWHGFGERLAEDYVLIDPIKVTITMPGLDIAGAMAGQGIPAAVVSKFLWTRGIVVEKTGLYSFLVLFSMGITKGKWSTLVAELLAFKNLYDRDAPLAEALPQLVEQASAVYAGMGLRGLCQRLHEFNREHRMPAVLNEMYTELPSMVLRPADAYDALVHGRVEHVGIDALDGRVAAAMLVPYPPGIPLIMPGERYDERTRAIVDYLHLAQAQDALLPGFESDIHGVVRDGDGRYLVEVLKARDGAAQ